MVYQNVAREVQRQKIPQSTLAKETGISPTKISLTFSGKRKMTPEELFKYCRYLGKDPDYFSDDLGAKEEKCKEDGDVTDQGEWSESMKLEKV